MTMKRLLLGLVTLSLALTTAPAAAEHWREEGFRRGNRVEQVHEHRAYGRWGYRPFPPAYRAPYAARHCYRRAGYLAWNGWRYVRVPSHVVCR